MNDDPKVTGRGKEIILPSRGDPFKKDLAYDEIRIPDPDRLDEIVMEVPTDDPRDLDPEELVAMFPSTAEERNKLPVEDTAGPQKAHLPLDSAEATGADTDLSPEDVAAMFPSSPEERNIIPGDEGDSIDPEVLAILDEMKAGSGVMEAMADDELPEPPFDALNPFADGFALGETEAAATEIPAPPVGGGISSPSADVVVDAEVSEIEIEPSGVGAGRPLDHYDPLVTDQIMEVEEIDDMLRLLVTNEQITALWHKIEQLENKIIANQAISSDSMQANIKRLKIARNNLLGGRKYYEDAERLVAEVEFDSAFSRRVRKWSYTWGSLILIYLLLWLFGLVAATIQISQGNVANLVPPVPGMDPNIFLTALVAGVLGGVTGAMRSLWVHVAQKQDFDPQHGMWYFLNPLMGLVLAVLMYWIFFAGILSAVGEPSGTGIFILYVLSWLSGFQQNVALQLVKRALNFILGGPKSDN